MQVASNKPYAPVYFDAEPMTKLPERVQSPPERPYAMGAAAREAANARPAPHARTTELAAARRPQVVENAPRVARSDTEPTASPVSAYAPVRYDPPVGFMGGRGLY